MVSKSAQKIRVKTEPPDPRLNEGGAGERCVLVSDIAAHLGISGNTLAMRLKRGGHALVKIADPESGHQSMAMSVEDARRVIADYKARPKVVSVDDIMKEQGQ